MEMERPQIIEAFRYHSPGPERVKCHERIRAKITDTVLEIAELLPPSRERSMFITDMQRAQMMANAAVAIHGMSPAAADKFVPPKKP